MHASGVTRAMRLQGRTAIVTGASRGIGRAVSERYASEGANVVLAARTAGQLEEVRREIEARGGSALAVPCDVRSEDHVRELVARATSMYGRIHVLVNNAGVYIGHGGVAKTDLETWRTTMETNVTGMFLCTRETLPHMPRDGSIINVTSGLAQGPSPSTFPYSLSKWTVEGLTTVLAAQVPQRVNAVDPGLVATDMTGESGKPPSAVTGVFVYLASDASRKVTGQRVHASTYARF